MTRAATSTAPPPAVAALAARVLTCPAGHVHDAAHPDGPPTPPCPLHPDPPRPDPTCPAGHVDPAHPPDADALAWTCSKPPARGVGGVWLARGPAAAVVIKAHAHPRGFAQELRAYRDWLPRLSPATPALLATDAPTRLLALSVAPGERLSEGTWSPAAERDAHAAAGRFARALHDLDAEGDDPMPLHAAVRARLARALAEAAPLLTPGERDGLGALARGADAFSGARRVPCHRDFTPDNWMSDRTCPAGHSRVTIVDFEHARLDAAEVDLVKLRADVWPARPDLEAAFRAGYGPLCVDGAARLGALLALHAAATLAWAGRHDDPQFMALGRRALAAALA